MHAFPTEYYRYLHYRRSFMRGIGRTALGIVAAAMFLAVAWLYLYFTGYIE